MNTQIPKVSTITSCYNMTRYLKDFLEKLPEQTFFEELEVVLDHNAPSKEELEWISSFQKKYPGRLKHIKLDHVDPIGVSWNRCIQEASANLLTIWNVDDLRTPASIEAQARILLEQPEISIVHGPYRVVGKFGCEEGPLVNHANTPDSELTRSMIIGPFFMFRRSLCAQAGLFDEQLLSGADFDLAIRLALHGKTAVTQKELGYYLNEGLGLSTRPNSRQPVERTVIELRYGIYDKIDYDFLPQAQEYCVPFILQNQEWVSVNKFIPDYEAFMLKRRQTWFLVGISKYAKQRFIMEPLINFKQKIRNLINWLIPSWIKRVYK